MREAEKRAESKRIADMYPILWPDDSEDFSATESTHKICRNVSASPSPPSRRAERFQSGYAFPSQNTVPQAGSSSNKAQCGRSAQECRYLPKLYADQLLKASSTWRAAKPPRPLSSIFKPSRKARGDAALAALADLAGRDYANEPTKRRVKFREDVRQALDDMVAVGGLSSWRCEEVGSGRKKGYRYHYTHALERQGALDLLLPAEGS